MQLMQHLSEERHAEFVLPLHRIQQTGTYIKIWPSKKDERELETQDEAQKPCLMFRCNKS